jgi:hypothetical protein
MTPPAPALILINTFNILENRKKKHIKLGIMIEKSLVRRAERAAEEEESQSDKMILGELNLSNFSEVSSEKEDNDIHDVPNQLCRVTTASHTTPMKMRRKL